jgi:hypothetical protein
MKGRLILMKRFLTIVLALAMIFTMALALTACDETGKCEACQTDGVKVTSLTVEDESLKLCDTCHETIKAALALADMGA